MVVELPLITIVVLPAEGELEVGFATVVLALLEWDDELRSVDVGDTLEDWERDVTTEELEEVLTVELLELLGTCDRELDGDATLDGLAVLLVELDDAFWLLKDTGAVFNVEVDDVVFRFEVLEDTTLEARDPDDTLLDDVFPVVDEVLTGCELDDLTDAFEVDVGELDEDLLREEVELGLKILVVDPLITIVVVPADCEVDESLFVEAVELECTLVDVLLVTGLTIVDVVPRGCELEVGLTALVELELDRALEVELLVTGLRTVLLVAAGCELEEDFVDAPEV